MRGYVIGEKVTLTGNPEPCMIPRPYQWERGGSMPKKYQRTAEKMVRESDKQTRGLVRGIIVILIIGGALGLIPSVSIAVICDSFGAWVYALFSVMLVTLFLMILLFLDRSVKKEGDSRVTALQAYDFQWRSGTLDDVVREIVDITYTPENGEQYKSKTSASVDGELISPFEMQDTRFSTVKKVNPAGVPVQALKVHGTLKAGDPVVLVRIGATTLILPQ